MTAVVGLLNKKGVAIAADSAVTRSSIKGTKCTKNGSKMLRLSNAVPVSVMLTGNADYMNNPWEVIVRRYRQQRGDIKHATVEACMRDFFAYISGNEKLWNENVNKTWISNNLNSIFRNTDNNIDYDNKRKKNGAYIRPKGYLNAFLKELKNYQKAVRKNSKCPQFEDYTIEQFREYANPVIDEYFSGITYDDEDWDPFSLQYQKEFIDVVRGEVEITLMDRLTRRMEDCDESAQIVFSGYGEEQEYPALISAVVCEGFDHRVNYHVASEDIVCISDDNPAAICPYAQTDVIQGLLKGLHPFWLNAIISETESFFINADINLFNEKHQKFDPIFFSMLSEVNTEDLIPRFYKGISNVLDRNQKEWTKTLQKYDLKSMAALAQSLIDLTGFHRILTFAQEGVGGPVDVAIITKNDGFTWLNRKSWYHHKDVNGMYGPLGI